MNFLEELKNIDPKKPAAWPWLVKLASFVVVLFAVVAMGAFFDCQEQD